MPKEFTTEEFTVINRKPGGFDGDDAAQDAALREFAPLGKKETLSRIVNHENVDIPKEGGNPSKGDR
ncbi:MAG: hypothetical protein A3E78_16710 [Alphaproteobacteria bacterium RIFCSPHIGHO2_12_FULL_63_12]|nr:MAG: hypothetical protein A3E78_16710 [Alphaproteobacteria bacterium RIFCSPHIGHO2_12_FULL_63_12]